MVGWVDGWERGVVRSELTFICFIFSGKKNPSGSYVGAAFARPSSGSWFAVVGLRGSLDIWKNTCEALRYPLIWFFMMIRWQNSGAFMTAQRSDGTVGFQFVSAQPRLKNQKLNVFLYSSCRQNLSTKSKMMSLTNHAVDLRREGR